MQAARFSVSFILQTEVSVEEHVTSCDSHDQAAVGDPETGERNHHRSKVSSLGVATGHNPSRSQSSGSNPIGDQDLVKNKRRLPWGGDVDLIRI